MKSDYARRQLIQAIHYRDEGLPRHALDAVRRALDWLEAEAFANGILDRPDADIDHGGIGSEDILETES